MIGGGHGRKAPGMAACRRKNGQIMEGKRVVGGKLFLREMVFRRLEKNALVSRCRSDRIRGARQAATNQEETNLEVCPTNQVLPICQSTPRKKDF